MTRKNKKYGKDFKLEAAKLVKQHGYSYAEAARQLGLEDWAVRGATLDSGAQVCGDHGLESYDACG